MPIVGIRELKNRLTHYLRLTRQGEKIVVTDRGRPVALLTSIGAAKRRQRQEDRLAELAERGLISLPRGRIDLKTPPVKIRGRPISETLMEDRS